MKQAKKRVLFSNYYDSEMEKCAKENCIERHLEDNPDDINWEPTNEEIYDEINFIHEMDWDAFEMNFKDFFDSNTFILQGYCGTWRGRMKGGFVFDSFKELSRAWEDCGYVEIYDENGHLYIQCSHHDGTNLYEIRLLNEKGYDYYANHKWYDDDEKLHDKLMNNPYSVLPHIAHKVFGCKKMEYVAI